MRSRMFARAADDIDYIALHPGLDAKDVILALAGLWQLDRAGDWRAQAQRIYDIVRANQALAYLTPPHFLQRTSFQRKK